MDWNKFSLKFHPSWHSKIQKFIESPECDEIFAFLKSKKEEGIDIAPSAFCLFKAFRDTSLDELKLVIIGENPYNTFVDDVPIDTGILFGANTRIQPNLQEFYAGIENEMYNGLDLSIIYNYDLEHYTSQGILMIPSSFTIERDAEKGHNKIWKPFMEFLLQEIIAYTGVPILFLGRSKQYMPAMEQSNYCYSLPMPVFGNIWNTEGVIKKINADIWDTNEEVILWRTIELPF
jgi:uracil-DNA glycosylase